ncbi:MAG: hypothetical protein ABIB71_07040 [Candidatus Woesearchaeota archaeon]
MKLGQKKVKLTNPRGLVREYQACGVNAIITILHHLGYDDQVTAEEIKEIFEYSSEGINLESHRFNKLNCLLKQKKIPYGFYIKKYTALQDLYPLLDKQGPVPVFFLMKVLQFSQRYYVNLEYEPHFGDVFQSYNLHVLLFVGFNQSKDEILFIDPSYQMPFIRPTEKDLTKHYFKLDKKQFYGTTRGVKTAILVKYSLSDHKRYKAEGKCKLQQSTLK